MKRLILSVALLFVTSLPLTAAEQTISRFVRQTAGADTVIVFVHGFGGDGVTTWTSSSGTYWPVMLTKDPAFDGTDIFVYSYTTGFAATLSIDELAEDMRRTLRAKGVAGYKKLIFLSHSMGGLVTRAYLLKNRDVAERTAFAYFFSTPTSGSQIASVARFVSASPQVAKMINMSPEDYLADLARQWLAARFSFPSYCAYEKRPTGGVALVVEMGSAVLLCTRPTDPIDADHMNIVKPETQDSAPYLAFKAAYAEAKIPALRSALSQTSVQLAGKIAEVARFPEAADTFPSTTLFEGMLKNRLPHRLFGTLEPYTQSEILEVAGYGQQLEQYKSDYYAVQTAARKWEEHLMSKIGAVVKVRFPAGWAIYAKYAILRFGGNTPKQIVDQGNFLNYDITWDDAERVFQEISSDNDEVQTAKEVFTNMSKVVEEANTVALASLH